MPYIKDKYKRAKFCMLIDEMMKDVDTVGDLNYVITRLVHKSIVFTVGEPELKHFNYKVLNSVIGVLECAKMEIHRMVISKYEDKKRLENGSVSDIDAVSLEEIR